MSTCRAISNVKEGRSGRAGARPSNEVRGIGLYKPAILRFDRGMPPPLEVYRDLPVRRVLAGETVVEQGVTDGRLLILIEGKLEVVKDDEVVTASATPGDIFGDLSVLLGIPHTTSVRAVRDSSFHVAEDGRQFLERNPAVSMHLCELLARRLVSATEYLVNLKHQYAGHDHLGMVDKVLDSLIHRHPRERVASRSSGVDIGEGEAPDGPVPR